MTDSRPAPDPASDDAARTEASFLEGVMRYLEGTLSETGAASLRNELAADPARRDMFALICLSDTMTRTQMSRSVADLVHLEEEESAGTSPDDAMSFQPIRLEPDPEEPRPMPAPSPASGGFPLRRASRWPVLAAAAGVFLALGVAAVVVVQSQRSPATIAALSDARWEGDAAGLALHSNLPAGTVLKLLRGSAGLRFADGVQVVAEAPVRFSITSNRAVKLIEGRVTVKLAEEKPGFCVTTPSAIATDLGTEFGVIYDPQSGDTGVHVFQGQVRVQAGPGEPATDVAAGDAADVRAGIVTLQPGQSSPQQFVRSLDIPATSLDLVDLLSGGDGTTARRGGLFDPTTGACGNIGPGAASAGDALYHRVSGVPVVDGVFSPDGNAGPSVLDSAGHTFLFPPTDHFTYDRIVAGGTIPVMPNTHPIGAALAGVNYAAPPNGLLLVHPNAGITLDLAAIRRLHPGARLTHLHCVVGNSFDTANNPDRDAAIISKSDAYVIVDGSARFEKRGLMIRDGAITVDVDLSDADRFLTLASTDGGDSQSYDDVLFGNSTLSVKPK